MMKIYGNAEVISALENMTAQKKTVQTVLFFGEKGTGKKTLAQYYIHLLMCENRQDGKPCFKCRACRNVADGIHPDVMKVEKSGKLGGISVETARKICLEAFIKPNNADKKVYLLEDCNNIDVRTQNTLLKIIEEPPEYAYFIFTAESKSKFLDTVISRCMCLGVSPCSESDCCNALSEFGFSSEQVESAVNCFHGNIGMCKDFLADEKLRENIRLTKSMADSIINKDEYMLNLDFYGLGKERENIKLSLTLLDKLIRDAVVLNYDKNAELIGCYPEGARLLADMVTINSGDKVHQCIENARQAIDSNVNILLVITALCGEICSILF